MVSIDSPTSGTLSDNETVTVSIENFGENPVTSFEISFQVNSGEIITEFVTNVAIQPGDVYQYSFTQTARGIVFVSFPLKCQTGNFP